tara:strand:- start:221 stop:391 length:171 start_codon:yes stop_codon:yes gene_type:complete
MSTPDEPTNADTPAAYLQYCKGRYFTPKEFREYKQEQQANKMRPTPAPAPTEEVTK